MADWEDKSVVLIPIPLLYNEDEHGVRKPIEDEKFFETGEELERKFDGCTVYKREANSTVGFWWDHIEFIAHKDPIVVFEMDVLDTEANREWLKAYGRDVLLKRFRQKAIYIKMIGPIQTLLIHEIEVGG